MGKSNHIVVPFLKKHIKPKGSTALLGFTDHTIFKEGDLYDTQLKNWEINSQWYLSKKYDTIICTRCASFASSPALFMLSCFNHLNPGGKLYVDWSLGDGWRFPFKVGWVKNGEHEFAYNDKNYLWSTVWDDEFLNDQNCCNFCKYIEQYGYYDLKKAVYDEVPIVLELEWIRIFFDVKYHILSFNDPTVQMYMLLECTK